MLQLAERASTIICEPIVMPRYAKPVRIALAKDAAFCFHYDDSLQVLRDMGAELVPFSPLADTALPDNIHGLYIGGGYPELYAERLNENSTMRASIRAVLERKLPCIAESGGFMYLTQSSAGLPMVGFLPGDAFDAGKLVRLGYVTLKAKKDNLLCKAGDAIRSHEFHRWDVTEPGGSFTAQKSSGASWDCVVATDHLYAGYPHIHFYANPAFAQSFYEACCKERDNHV